MKHTGLDSQPILTLDHSASIQWMVSKNVAILWGQWDFFRFKVNGSTLRWPETTKWNNSPRLHTTHLLFLYQRSVYHTRSTMIASWDFLLQQPQKADVYISHRPWHSERIYASLPTANIFIFVQHFMLQMPTERHSWLWTELTSYLKGKRRR